MSVSLKPLRCLLLLLLVVVAVALSVQLQWTNVQHLAGLLASHTEVDSTQSGSVSLASASRPPPVHVATPHRVNGLSDGTFSMPGSGKPSGASSHAPTPPDNGVAAPASTRLRHRLLLIPSTALSGSSFTSQSPRVGNLLFNMRIELAIARMTGRTLVPRRFLAPASDGRQATVLDMFADFFSASAMETCVADAAVDEEVGERAATPLVLTWDELQHGVLDGEPRPKLGLWQLSGSRPPLLRPGVCDASANLRFLTNADRRALERVVGPGVFLAGSEPVCVQSKLPKEAMARLTDVDAVLMVGAQDVGFMWTFKQQRHHLGWLARHLPSGFWGRVAEREPRYPSGRPRHYPECLLTPHQRFVDIAREYVHSELSDGSAAAARFASVHLRLGDALSYGHRRLEKHKVTPAASVAELLGSFLDRRRMETGAPRSTLFVAAEPHPPYLELLHDGLGANVTVVTFDPAKLRGQTHLALSGNDSSALVRDQRLLLVERIIAALSTEAHAAFPGASTFGDDIAFLRRLAFASGHDTPSDDRLGRDQKLMKTWVDGRQRALGAIPLPDDLERAIATELTRTSTSCSDFLSTSADQAKYSKELATVALFLQHVYLGPSFTVLPISGDSGETAGPRIDIILAGGGTLGIESSHLVGSDVPGTTDDQKAQVWMRTNAACLAETLRLATALKRSLQNAGDEGR